jgi:hypothetical protein
MKCRFAHGKVSIVLSTDRRGVAVLGAVLQDVPDVSLYAVCTEDPSGNRFWTTLWYRKVNRDVAFPKQLYGMPGLVFKNMREYRDNFLAPLTSLNFQTVEEEEG